MLQPDNRSFWSKPSTLILIAGIIAIAIMMIAVIAVMAITSRSASEASSAQSSAQAVEPTLERLPIVQTVEKLIVITATPRPTSPPSPTPLPTATFTPEPTPTPAPTPTPLPPPKWSELGNLSSVEYTGTTVVERMRRREGIGGVLLGSDRVVLMAVGKIRAGIDLNKIKPSDVQINDRAIKIKLPRAEIFTVELLPEASRVFDSQRSWLYSEYEGLELEALEEARRRLREEGQRNTAMLDIAETMARLQLTEFLRKAGFEQVEIEFER